MSLKTDYKNEILGFGTERTYNIVDDLGNVIYPNIHLEKTYIPEQYGDDFSATDINNTNTAINGLSTSVENINESIRDLTGDTGWRDLRGNISRDNIKPLSSGRFIDYRKIGKIVIIAFDVVTKVSINPEKPHVIAKLPPEITPSEKQTALFRTSDAVYKCTVSSTGNLNVEGFTRIDPNKILPGTIVYFV